jgi:hypothetical protein
VLLLLLLLLLLLVMMMTCLGCSIRDLPQPLVGPGGQATTVMGTAADQLQQQQHPH